MERRGREVAMDFDSQGSDVIAKLSQPTQILFALSFFLALAVAVVTVYITAIAAQGVPHDDFRPSSQAPRFSLEKRNRHGLFR
jgi:hypothetical protein